jgi:glycine hydroxymethyltransferase
MRTEATQIHTDTELLSLVAKERRRQSTTLSLIASESYALVPALKLQGTHLSQKLIEGYPGKPGRTGSVFADDIERLALRRACSLFGAEHANVQAYSGSLANLAAVLALVPRGSRILVMPAEIGGHHTLGGHAHLSGALFEVAHAPIDPASGLLDYDAIERYAATWRPRLLAVGSSFYPRRLDFERLAMIARSVGAVFLADIAHLAGLVVAGLHPSPVPVADVVTSSTHKTLTGPRGGGLLLSRQVYADAVDAAVYPLLQGAPTLDVIAARAALFRAVATPYFRRLMHNVVDNARALAADLQRRGLEVVTGGTDTHLLVLDPQRAGPDAAEAKRRLEALGIYASIVPLPTGERQGLRLGSVPVTQRGMGPDQMDTLADLIAAGLAASRPPRRLRATVRELARSFPSAVGY